MAASDTTALPETLDDAAAYFDPRDTDEIADVMHRLLDDESLRTRLLARAPRVLAQYRWETMADETVDVYREVLDTK